MPIVTANYSLSTLSSPCQMKAQIHAVFQRLPEGLVSPASRECVWRWAWESASLLPHPLPPGVLKPESGPWKLCHLGGGHSWPGAGLNPSEKARLRAPAIPLPWVGAQGTGSWPCFACCKNQNQRRKGLSLQFLFLDFFFFKYVSTLELFPISFQSVIPALPG